MPKKYLVLFPLDFENFFGKFFSFSHFKIFKLPGVCMFMDLNIHIYIYI